MPDNVLKQFKPKDFNLELVKASKEIINRTFLSPKSLAILYNLPTNSWRVYLYYPVRIKYLLVRYTGIILGKNMQTLTAQNNKI
ncbi:hypothetical protein [Candidatus Marithrix sp. Canyon 246]|nr:hypothetical protein [Candidatus Marithrix sp. Canyon 246]